MSIEVVSAAAELLAMGRCHAVLSKALGLRLGSSQLLRPQDLSASMFIWMESENLVEILLAAPHFGASEWQTSLSDDAFPAAFLHAGGGVYHEFIKVLFVNSFDPGLQFVAPYQPTECLATYLLQDAAPVDACVYDPNLEAEKVIAAFPCQPLRLFRIVEEERFDLIVQVVFNVDYDIRLLCELRRRAPTARLVIGGPHLKTVDLTSYFRALPIDGAILGDGEVPLLQLVRLPCGADLTHVPGLVIPHSRGCTTALPAVPLQGGPNIAAFTRHLPNVWGLRPYRSRAGVASSRGGRALAYDVIGQRPLRIITSQRCGKPCYWCRSPKAIAPRNPEDVIREIEQHYDACDSIHIEDNDIWFDPSNFNCIGKGLISRGLTSKPILVKTSTDRMTADRADFLRQMGVRIVAFGVESFTQRCLDLLHKETTVEQNHRAVQLALAVGIKAGINAIWLVPGIDLAATWDLVLSVIPYLKRGAYLNLVPELALGDIRITRAIRGLMNEGHIHSEPRHLPGALGPLEFLVLNLPEPMALFREAVLRRTEDEVAAHRKVHEMPNVSVAVWSLFLLRSIVREFPAGHELTEGERRIALADIGTILEAVLGAEKEYALLCRPLNVNAGQIDISCWE